MSKVVLNTKHNPTVYHQKLNKKITRINGYATSKYLSVHIRSSMLNTREKKEVANAVLCFAFNSVARIVCVHARQHICAHFRALFKQIWKSQGKNYPAQKRYEIKSDLFASFLHPNLLRMSNRKEYKRISKKINFIMRT